MSVSPRLAGAVLGLWALAACSREERPSPAMRPREPAAPDTCPQHAGQLAQVLGPEDCAVARSIFFPPPDCPTGQPIPHPEPDGKRMSGIATDSIYAKCGFPEGDVWLKVNEVALASPEGLLDAYANLRRAPALTFRVKRAGRPLTIRVDLR